MNLVDTIKKTCKRKRPVERRRVEINPLPTVINNEQINNNNQNNINKPTCSNWISTTKYTLLTFIPKNLFEQFCRIANLYFLFILTLSYTPVSPVMSGPATINLGIVLLINAVKEGYEDFKRYQSDKHINHQITQVIKNGEIINKYWKELEVGDIVKVNDGQQFPADLVLLSTACETSPGLCYIETSNLDGETNLKTKQALIETNSLQTVEDVTQFHALIECEAPSLVLSKFDGRVSIKKEQTSADNTQYDMTLPLTCEQLLIRGTQLMNTKHIYGVVVYTGHETKYMLNTMATPSKRSKLERAVNRILLYVLMCEALLCLTSAILGMMYERKFGVHSFYLGLARRLGLHTLERFFTFVVLYSTMVPISLYVTMELVRVFQVMVINRDKKMYHSETNTFAKARTSNLNEELGQIEYIFSDKTGTLTRNEMEFRVCCINGITYGSLSSDYLANTESILSASQDISTSTNIPGKNPLKSPSISALGPKAILNKSISNFSLDCGFRPLRIDFSDSINLEFFISMALCHTVIPENVSEENEDGQVITTLKYSSSSPDEIALVNAANNLGVKFHSRTPNSMIININGEDRSYSLLNVLEFSSDRKRMSVIVRETNSQEIIMYCKGADTAILPFMAALEDEKEKEQLKMNEESLKTFSCNGLRTLCIAKRVLDPVEYDQWNQLYKKASISIDDRERKVNEVSAMIETGWKLIGITGIEDKLQDQVPSTISTLSRANIKIWMLTGDKQETAINIGISCGLLEGVDITILNESSSTEALISSIDSILNEVRGSLGINDLGMVKLPSGAGCPIEMEQTNTSPTISTPSSPTSMTSSSQSISSTKKKCGALIKPREIALVVDGATLTLALTKDVEDKFYELSCLCKSVVCCRVTPFQKSEVVRMVKDRTQSITLAIGDGANDVSMIQKAHIGIGISGKEGRQAVLASDFAISQFRYLERLVLVHGRYNYKRLCILICYFFFKNLVASLLQLWYSANTQFSGQTFYDSVSILGYNLIFTSLPIIIIGVFEKDVGTRYLRRFPHLYRECQMGLCFNHRIFWSWIVYAVFCSWCIYYFASHIFIEGALDESGRVGGMWNTSAAGFTFLVFVVNLRLALCVNSWTLYHHLAIWGSLVVYVFIECIYSVIYLKYTAYFHLIFIQLISLPVFYFSIFVTVFCALLPVYTLSFVNRNYFTKPIHIAQEIMREEKLQLQMKLRIIRNNA